MIFIFPLIFSLYIQVSMSSMILFNDDLYLDIKNSKICILVHLSVKFPSELREKLYDWLETVIESMNLQRSIKSDLDVKFPVTFFTIWVNSWIIKTTILSHFFFLPIVHNVLQRFTCYSWSQIWADIIWCRNGRLSFSLIVNTDLSIWKKCPSMKIFLEKNAW